MRSMKLIAIAAAAVCFGACATTQAQFADDSDYEYTVLYETPASMSLADLYYDYALYIESPSISGYWVLIERFETLAEAEAQEAFFASTYNTEIVPLYDPPALQHYRFSTSRYYRLP